jgi:prephenate dehydrogenase
VKPAVAIVGLGLVGGSLARALTRAGYVVIGVDRAAVLRRARRARAVSRTAVRVEDAATQADVVVLAATPAANLRLLRRVARAAPRALVTDVGSVKGPIVRAAASLRLKRFVGGHPMAGSERSGFAASDAGLFRGRTWILTPERAAAADVAVLRRLVRAAGARPRIMTPAAHDRAVAFLSHVPQVLAWALRDAARRDAVAARHARIAGPGFRDMTRLARSPRGLWREILDQNRRQVSRALAAVRRELGRRR